MKSFHSGVIFPQSPKLGVGKTGTSLRAGYRSRDQRYYCNCLLHVVVQGPGSFRGLVNFLVRRNLRLRSYGASKLPQFSDFGLFSPYKTPKNVPSGDQPTAKGLHRRMILIFPYGSRRSKGVPFGSEVFLRLLVGEL